MEHTNRNIICDADQCIHNDGHLHCTADGIKVGTQNACCCDDTRCATFSLDRKKCDCK